MYNAGALCRALSMIIIWEELIVFLVVYERNIICHIQTIVLPHGAANYQLQMMSFISSVGDILYPKTQRIYVSQLP